MSSLPAALPSMSDCLSFGDVLQRLANLAPDDLKALEVLARDQLHHRIRQQHDRLLKEWLHN